MNTKILKHLEKRTIHPSVMDPLCYLLSIAPHSITPALCLAVCELIDGQVMDAACAIQLMHAGHSLPYPTPLSWKSRVIDLIARNGMLPLRYQIMTNDVVDDDDDDAERRLRVVVEISIAMGEEGGVVEVQLVEVEGREEKDWVCERRGVRLSLYRAMCEAIMGRGREEEVERMWRLGMHVDIINKILL